MPAAAIKRVFSGIRTAEQRKTDEMSRLTGRELEILTLFPLGQSYAQIAQARGKPATDDPKYHLSWTLYKI